MIFLGSYDEARNWLISFLDWSVQEALSPLFTKELLEGHLRKACKVTEPPTVFPTLEDFIYDFCGNFSAETRRPHSEADKIVERYRDQSLPIRKVWFSTTELREATNGFSKRVGHGHVGIVFYGFMEQPIAVKRVKKVKEDSLHKALHEVAVHGVIKKTMRSDIPIVNLLGCAPCLEDPLTVFEYIPISFGNLKQHLRGNEESYVRKYPAVRLRIAIDVASALGHLHYKCEWPIYHRDVKSSNVLLDDAYRAKLTGLGEAVIVMREAYKQTNVVVGSSGYIDPLYKETCVLDDKSDVYSFGVLLMELTTLLTAWQPTRAESLPEMISEAIASGRGYEYLEPGPAVRMRDMMAKMLGVANDCCSLDLTCRPRIDEVEVSLRQIEKELLGK